MFSKSLDRALWEYHKISDLRKVDGELSGSIFGLNSATKDFMEEPQVIITETTISPHEL